jgi:hypothetical protein
MCSKLNVDIIIDTILWWHCDTMFGSMIVSTFHFEYIVKVLEKHKYMEGESLIPYICTLWPNNVFIKHVINTYCRNPSFGLATKARGCGSQEERSPGVKRKEARESKGRKPGSKGKGIGRVRAKRKPGSHQILPGVITYSRESKEVRGSVREWAFTLPRQLPFWESASWRVKSQWIVALLVPLESSWNVNV